MLRNYLKVSFRNLRRHKVFSFINVLGLAIGMCCCLIIFFYVRSQTGYDQYHEHKDNLYRLTIDIERLSSQEIDGTSATSSILWAPALKREYPEIDKFCRIMEDRATTAFRVGEEEFEEENVFFSDGSVFKFFSWPLLAGDAETALTEPQTIVLSESMARKYFGTADPIGRILTAENEIDYRITGVMQDVPFKTHVRPDFLISFITLNRFFEADVHAGVHPYDWYWRGRIAHTYLKLSDGFQPKNLEAKFPGFLDKYVGGATITRGYKYHPFLQPVAEIHLEGSVSDTLQPGGDRGQLYLFSFIAFFILLIACINFMNLSTARSGTRSREVGIRKVVGADQKRLVKQFMGESLLLSLLALAVALLLAEVLNPIFYDYIGRSFYFDRGDLPLYVIAIAGITLFAAFLAGSYPAFYLSRFRPTPVLQRAFSSGSRAATFRKVLVVAQFALTVFFVIGTITVYSQIRFMRSQDLGFQQSQLLVIPPGTTRPHLNQLASHAGELTAHSAIESSTISSAIPGRDIRSDVWGEKGKAGAQGIQMNEFAVDYDFLQVYGLELTAGRSFQRQMTTDAAPADVDSNGYEIAGIINEAAVKGFGWTSPEEALGKQLLRDPAANDFTCRVVGVARDFHFRSLHEDIGPAILFINPNYFSTSRFLSLKVSGGNLSKTIAQVRSQFEAAATGSPFEYFFMDEDFGRLYEQDERMMEIYGNISALMILISCLGLFGLASFSAEQRTKEVGIRKVLGASVAGLVSLLSKDFLKLIAIANLIAWPIAYYLMSQWLEDYAYRFELGPATFLLSALLTFVIALLTVSTQAIKAALTNPVNSLRYE